MYIVYAQRMENAKLKLVECVILKKVEASVTVKL